MVNSVTIDRFAQCGVTGRPASAAIRAIASVRPMPPTYITSGCTMSTALHVDHASPGRDHAVLLAAGHVDGARRQRLGHFAGLLELPIRAGFLEMGDAVLLQKVATIDGLCRGIAGIGVHQQRDVLVPEGARDGRHDLFGAPFPFVTAASDLGADAELEGVEPMLAAQAAEPLRLGCGVMSRFIDDA